MKGYPLSEFHPRDVVFGPDGLLYVSGTNFDPNFGAVLGAAVVRFDACTKEFVDVFFANTTVDNFNRVEGIGFSPDGDLVVTSFRASEDDTDKLYVIGGPGRHNEGMLIDAIPLAPPGNINRAFAQDFKFGPDGYLYTAITGGNSTNTGQIRRYNMRTKTFDVLDTVPDSPTLVYCTFGRTDPATFNYK
jgi:hypothetical protein